MTIGKDKLRHFALCALVAVCVVVVMRLLHTSSWAAFLAGVFCSVGVGGGKEYGDAVSPVNRWDWLDMLADALGGLFGSSIGLLLWM